MANVTPASAEFVEALRRGLEAYDRGDSAEANGMFDQALEIEPDNVWGLLWKGATAASPSEARGWLEQAIALDPNNEHARAGLQWAGEQGGMDGTATVTAPSDTEANFAFDDRVADDGYRTGMSEGGAVSLAEDEPSDEDLGLFDLGSSTAAGDDYSDDGRGYDEGQAVAEVGRYTGESEDQAEARAESTDEPERYEGESDAQATARTDEAADESLPDWLSGEDDLFGEPMTDALSTEEGRGEADNSWLFAEGDDERTPAATTASDLPDWLRDDGDGAASAPEGRGDPTGDAGLPDWLRGEDFVEGRTADGDNLPDWLRGDEAAASRDNAPDGDRSDATTTAATLNEEALPDWLRGDETPAATASADDDLPDWLMGDDDRADAQRDTGLPDWMSDSPATATAEASAPAADLPDWLLNDDVAIETPSQDDLPSWLTSADQGDDSTFQASRSRGSLEASSDAVAAYQTGMLAYEEDRLDDAVTAFQRVIRLEPNHVEAHNYLGSVYYLNGRPNEAIGALRRALELDPNHAESYLNLGLVYKETSNNAQAMQMFRRYIDLAPDDSTAEYVRDLIKELGG